MFASCLMRWFARADYAVRDENPQVRATPTPVPCAPSSSASVPAVAAAGTDGPDDLVIRVKGEASVDTADALAEALLAPAARRRTSVDLDLSELSSISCLAMGVLVNYRRGVVRAGGRVRLAGVLQPGVYAALERASLFDLFDTTLLATAPAP